MNEQLDRKILTACLGNRNFPGVSPTSSVDTALAMLEKFGDLPENLPIIRKIDGQWHVTAFDYGVHESLPDAICLAIIGDA